MRMRQIILPFSFLIFFFIILLIPGKVTAQTACTIDQVFQTCGEGNNFACITPSPTPATINPWIKVKSSSFSGNSESSLSGFSIPVAAGARQSFNASGDADDVSNLGYFLYGDSSATAAIESGVVSAPSIGSGIEEGISDKDWVIEGYTRDKQFSPSKFLDYAIARKRIKNITDLADMEKDRVNIIEGGTSANITEFCGSNDPFDSANFIKTAAGDIGPYVLVVKGDLRINRDINHKKSGIAMTCAPKGISIASGGTYTPIPLTLVVTGTLTINSTDAYPDQANQINALVMAQDVVINPVAETSGDPYGLKIKGNLLVQDTLTNNRFRDDSRRPAIFIVQDPGTYMYLLPYFSTATYEWQDIK